MTYIMFKKSFYTFAANKNSRGCRKPNRVGEKNNITNNEIFY